ncbi:XapX domain-containing protein [Ferdinandcohnia sp. Marseille-Q9671]
MKEVIIALFTGLIVGFVFALLKLPIPAPPALAGVTGIIGIYLGFKIFQWIAPLIQR